MRAVKEGEGRTRQATRAPSASLCRQQADSHANECWMAGNQCFTQWAIVDQRVLWSWGQTKSGNKQRQARCARRRYRVLCNLITFSDFCVADAIPAWSSLCPCPFCIPPREYAAFFGVASFFSTGSKREMLDPGRGAPPAFCGEDKVRVDAIHKPRQDTDKM